MLFDEFLTNRKMGKINFKNESGTTLIEVIIYMLLVSFVMAGALVSVYQILDSNESLSSKTAIEQEANFIIAKLEWGLNDLLAINSPAPNTSGGTLSVDKNGYASNPIVFSLNGDDMTIQKGSAEPVVINSDRMAVATLSFEFIRQTGALTADSIRASFFLNDHYFETYKYIR